MTLIIKVITLKNKWNIFIPGKVSLERLYLIFYRDGTIFRMSTVINCTRRTDSSNTCSVYILNWLK